MKKKCIILMLLIVAVSIYSCHGNTEESTDAGIDQTGALVSAEDARFAVEAAELAITGVELSYFAKDKLTNAKAKTLADQLLKDYANTNTELIAITKPKKVTLPVSLDSDGQDAKDLLSQKTGADFDKDYIAKIAADNEKALKLYQDGADDMKDNDLKAFAAKTLLILKKHADVIKTIQDSMK